MKFKQIFPDCRVVRFLPVLSLLSGCALLAGCCSNGTYGKVAIEWSRMIREQQVTPVYPPREDIRVGDVFYSAEDPNKDPELKNARTFLPIPTLFTRIPLEPQLKSGYTLRPPYPKTPADKLVSIPASEKSTNVVTGTNGSVTTTIKEFVNAAPVVERSTTTSTNSEGAVSVLTKEIASQVLKVLPDSEEATDDGIFAAAAPNRLRHVAFPEFSFAKISQSQLQAVVPVEALNVAFAVTSSRAKQGYVKISSGESISLPAKQMWDALAAELLDPSGALKQDYGKVLKSMLQSHAYPKRAWLVVINEAFYARTIDVAMSDKRSVGGGVNVGGSSSTNTLSATDSPAARASQLNAINANLLSQSTPGGSVSFISVSDFGLGLRRTYARPIAIGVRALAVEVELNNDIVSVKSVAQLDTAKPQFILTR